MKRVLCVLIGGCAALLTGCQSSSPNQPLDQGKIVAVQPAVPDGARSFVTQQQKLEQDRRNQQQRRSWFGSRSQAAQPAGPSFWQRLFGPRQPAQPQEAPAQTSPPAPAQNPPPAQQAAPVSP